jgi:hypothetical protein
LWAETVSDLGGDPSGSRATRKSNRVQGLRPTLSLAGQKVVHKSRMVKKLEWIEMTQLAVSSILFKSLSLKLQ